MANSRLAKLWRSRMIPPDDREIWEWFHAEGELPPSYAVSGRFDVDTAPMVKGPLRALRDPRVREVVSQSGVQCLKTLLGEMWILWSIVNDPGPTQWLQPTDQEAKEHAEERFQDLIDSFPSVHRFFTSNRHHKKTARIKFKHMTLMMEGAETKSNFQRKSIKNQMRSEVWQTKYWNKGDLGEADSRMTQFVHNSKAYTESQPGYAAHMDIDDMDARFVEGSQEHWNFKCLGCGKSQRYFFSFTREDGSRAAMRWNTNEHTRRANGQWRWGELVQTIRYECIHCGHAHADIPRTRRRMNASGHYIAENPDAPETIRSFSWNQLAMMNLSWFETKIGGVKNFLLAWEQAKRGFDRPLIEFFQKVVADPYDPSKHSITPKMPTIEVYESADDKAITYDGIRFLHRFMAVDVQADHFWVLVEIWSDNGDDLTIHAGQVWTWDEVAAIQEKFQVMDEDVMVDQSHRGIEVVRECCRHGHEIQVAGRHRKEFVCWKAMRGSDQDGFRYVPRRKNKKQAPIMLPYTWPPQIGDPCIGLHKSDPRLKELAGRYCMIITWSNPTIKDAAISRRDGLAKGIQTLQVKAEWNDEFSRQMHSQKKVSVDGKYGSAKWKWVKFRDDHLLDCKCMIITRAFMRGLLGGQGADSGDDEGRE